MITIDRREIREAEEHHPDVPVREVLGVELHVDTLNAGDFAFLDRNQEPLGIERCEISNLTEKLRSGELEDQIIRCVDQYMHIILLVEGVWDDTSGLLTKHKPTNRGYFRIRIEPHIRYTEPLAAMIRLSELGIETLQTPNFECSLIAVRTLYHQRSKPEDQHQMFKRTRKPRVPMKLTNNPAVPRLMSLIPRMPEKVAIRLMHQYGTIWSIIHAEDRVLMETEGVNKGSIGKLRESLGKPD